MANLRPSAALSNLQALVDHLAVYPSQTVRRACDLLGVESPRCILDLLDCSGAEAVDALEAEIFLHQHGRAA